MTTKHYIAILTFATAGEPAEALHQNMLDLVENVDPSMFVSNRVQIFERV